MKKVEQAEDSVDLSCVLGYEDHSPLAAGSGMTSSIDKGVETVALDLIGARADRSVIA